MKRKMSLVALSACAALAGAQAQEPRQQERHVIASPNPTIDDSKTGDAAEPGELTATKVRPVAATTAAPMKKKKAAGSKRKRTKPPTG